MNKKETGLLALLSAIFLCASGIALAQGASSGKYREGIHYDAIEGAAAVSGDTVEVVEAFSYLCSHCGTFEPFISNWLQRKPEYVNFKRIPVVFGRSSWEIYAIAYTTAELMGIADAGHGALMNKLWKDRQVLRSLDELGEFYAAYGTNAQTFIATSKSFAVDAKMRKDQRDLQAAGVRGTPSMIVNGKYLVSSNEAVGSYDVMLDVVDYLISVESFAQNVAATAQEAATEEITQAATE